MEHAAAHARARPRWKFDATYPDGRTEIVLAVPNYDFNWQTDYVFKQPLKLPKGTMLETVGVVRQLDREQVATRIRRSTCTGASRRGRRCSSPRSPSRSIRQRRDDGRGCEEVRRTCQGLGFTAYGSGCEQHP